MQSQHHSHLLTSSNHNFKEPVSSPVKQNAVSLSLSLSLWPVLTASHNFPILNLPCAFSPSFLHTFTFSSRDQSAGQDVVPLEPWSIAVAHEERKKMDWRKRRESGWTSLCVLLSMHWHGLCGSPLRFLSLFKMLKTNPVCTAQNCGCVILMYCCFRSRPILLFRSQWLC